MKLKIITMLFVMVQLVFAQDQQQVCKDLKDKGQSKIKECVAIGQGTSGYNTCMSELGKMRQNFTKLCAGSTQGSGGIEDQIKGWENVQQSCGKDESCSANAIIRLGQLWRQKEEADLILCEETFSKKFQKWQELGKRGEPPQKCTKDVSNSLGYFEDVIQNHPKFGGYTQALMQASYIYLATQREEKAAEYWMTLVTKFPGDKYAPQAWLRLGEYYFNNRKNKEAIDAYNHVVGKTDLQGKEGALAQYHLAEALNNVGDFDGAADKFYNYVVGADEGKFPKDLRHEAIEYMASCYADMNHGIDNAAKYLNRKDVKFEDTLYYYIGDKNFKRDRLDEAHYSFDNFLSNMPNSSLAPKAYLQILDILEETKRFDEAQLQRKKILNQFASDSPWWANNSNNKSALFDANLLMQNVYYKYPIYYHRKAMELDSIGDKIQAIQAWGNAVEANKKYLSLYVDSLKQIDIVRNLLGIEYQKLSKFKEAAVEFKKHADFVKSDEARMVVLEMAQKYLEQSQVQGTSAIQEAEEFLDQIQTWNRNFNSVNK